MDKPDPMNVTSGMGEMTQLTSDEMKNVLVALAVAEKQCLDNAHQVAQRPGFRIYRAEADEYGRILEKLMKATCFEADPQKDAVDLIQAAGNAVANWEIDETPGHTSYTTAMDHLSDVLQRYKLGNGQ